MGIRLRVKLDNRGKHRWQQIISDCGIHSLVILAIVIPLSSGATQMQSDIETFGHLLVNNCVRVIEANPQFMRNWNDSSLHPKAVCTCASFEFLPTLAEYDKGFVRQHARLSPDMLKRFLKEIRGCVERSTKKRSGPQR